MVFIELHASLTIPKCKLLNIIAVTPPSFLLPYIRAIAEPPCPKDRYYFQYFVLCSIFKNTYLMQILFIFLSIYCLFLKDRRWKSIITWIIDLTDAKEKKTGKESARQNCSYSMVFFQKEYRFYSLLVSQRWMH